MNSVDEKRVTEDQASEAVNHHVGRFAPSPTGPLHFGSLVAAVASWLDARAANGRWLVRMEDLDRPRCVPGAADAILRQLETYGLEWDGPVMQQSRRHEAYAAALDRLRALGAVFACACSRSQLVDASRNADGEIVYPGTCRAGLPDAAKPHAWRVRVDDVSIRFRDRVYGELEQSLGEAVGDFVVKRADGLFAYQLAVVVDDAAQAVTHVVRGADLLWNTPRQIHLQSLLDVPTPAYAHVPLVTNVTGQKLSKQTRAPALSDRDRGVVLAQALAVLGHSSPGELHGAAPAELLAWARAHWAVENVPTRPAVVSPAESATISPDP